MKKSTKENIKSLFDDVEDYKDFKKSEIGKSSFWFLLSGSIMLVGGIIGFFIVLSNEVSDQAYDLLSLLFFITVLGAYFSGLHLGQARYYYLSKKKK